MSKDMQRYYPEERRYAEIERSEDVQRYKPEERRCALM